MTATPDLPSDRSHDATGSAHATSGSAAAARTALINRISWGADDPTVTAAVMRTRVAGRA